MGPRKSHEKATKKPRKSNEKGPNTVFLDRRGPRKSHEKVTSKNSTSNEKSSEKWWKQDLLQKQSQKMLWNLGLKSWERPGLLQSPEMARPGISTNKKHTERLPPRRNSGTWREKYTHPKIPKTLLSQGILGVFFFPVFQGIFGVHKMITYEELHWNLFLKITNFTRNFLKKSFFPGDFELSSVIRASQFARFVRIGWFARIGNSSDSCESAWRAKKNRGFKCEWFARIDSRESHCESPVPLRFWGYKIRQKCTKNPSLGLCSRGGKPWKTNREKDHQITRCFFHRLLEEPKGHPPKGHREKINFK